MSHKLSFDIDYETLGERTELPVGELLDGPCGEDTGLKADKPHPRT